MSPSRVLLAALACAGLSCASGSATPREQPAALRAPRAHLASLASPAEPSALPAAALDVAPSSARSQATATIAFVGDMAMILPIANHLDGAGPPGKPRPTGFPFHQVADELRAYDLLIGNLECVVSDRGSPRAARTLKASLATPAALLEAGFDAVSVANNHALDLSWPGFYDMLARLDDAGLPRAGALGAEDRDAHVVLETKGLRVAIVGQFLRAPVLALRDVERAEAVADVTVVFLHWGAEYQVEVLAEQRALARALLDHGADAIVGAHPHVVQPDELYQGKPIVYSLGNFVFPLMWKPGTHNGALLELDIAREGVVGHRYRRVALDDAGAPSFVGEPTQAPPLHDAPAGGL